MKSGVLDDALVQGQRGLDADHGELGQAAAQPGDRLRRGSARARSAWRSCCRNRAAPCSRNTAPKSTRTPSPPGAWKARHPAGGRHEGLRVLGVDPALDGVAGEADVGLPVAERRAGGDADLLAHQVDAADHLGDRVLDLQPRVHLDERELAVLIQELQRAGVAVAEARQRRGRPSRPARRAAPRSAPASRPPPAISGGAVAGCSRARRNAPRCRGRRPAPATRYGAAGRDISRDRRRRCRTPRAPRRARPARPPPARPASCATFMPRPPPPAAALISTG